MMKQLKRLIHSSHNQKWGLEMIDLSGNGKPFSNDLFVEEIFLRPSSPDAPPELTEDALRILSCDLPVIETPEDLIREFLILPEETAILELSKEAESIHCSEPTRAAKLRICRAGMSVLKAAATMANEVRVSAWSDMKNSHVDEIDRGVSRSRWGLWTIPLFLTVAICCVLGGASLLVNEPTNGLVLLDLSGHLEGYPLGIRLALVTVPSFGTFMAIWGLLASLKPTAVKRLSFIFFLLFIPVSILTAILFAMRMGAEISPNPFYPEPFPPFWVVICLFMVCSAGTAVAAKLVGRRVAFRLLGIELRESTDLVFHSERAMRWNSRWQQAECLASQFHSIVDQIQHDQAVFVSQCLTKLKSAKHYIDDVGKTAAEEAKRRALPNLKILTPDSFERSIDSKPRRNGQNDSSMTSKPH